MFRANKLKIATKSWEGFQGMYVYYTEYETVGYFYKIKGSYYNALSLIKEEANISAPSYQKGLDLMDPFIIDTNGSEILVINIEDQSVLYQKLQNGVFVELHEDEDEIIGLLSAESYTLKVPLPNGRDIDGVFEELILSKVDEFIIDEIYKSSYDEQKDEHIEMSGKEILQILNKIR